MSYRTCNPFICHSRAWNWEIKNWWNHVLEQASGSGLVKRTSPIKKVKKMKIFHTISDQFTDGILNTSKPTNLPIESFSSTICLSHLHITPSSCDLLPSITLVTVTKAFLNASFAASPLPQSRSSYRHLSFSEPSSSRGFFRWFYLYCGFRILTKSKRYPYRSLSVLSSSN